MGFVSWEFATFSNMQLSYKYTNDSRVKVFLLKHPTQTEQNFYSHMYKSWQSANTRHSEFPCLVDTQINDDCVTVIVSRFYSHMFYTHSSITIYFIKDNHLFSKIPEYIKSLLK